MGGCCCKDDSLSEQGEPTERDPLLPPSSSTGVSPANYSGNQQKGHNGSGPLRDEQSVLNQILHNTASNIINVGAGTSDVLEQREHQERLKLYSARLAMSAASRARRPATPSHAYQVQALLSAPPLSAADVHLICQAADGSARAVKDVQVVYNEGDLIVQLAMK